MYLITGGLGFLGTNIASFILQNSTDSLVVFDNFYREGSEQNLAFLKSINDNFVFCYGDIRNINDIEEVVKKYQPDIVYHLAGQVAMTSSIINPRYDFEVNALGSFNLLDSIRKYKSDAIVIYSSSNKVYGDLESYNYIEEEKRYVCIDYPNGFNEEIPLDFHSPYGCSKGCGDMYMLDFYRIYGIRSVVFRHSSMYGGRQFATINQGWIGYFIKEILGGGGEIVVSGSGKQVRDILYASDMVELYLAAPKHIINLQGKAYNIGGGVKNSLSILELFDIISSITKIDVKYSCKEPRQSDQRVFIADLSRINRDLGFEIKVDKNSGIEKMIKWVKDTYKL